MKAHIVLAHPENQSFNGQLANLSKSKLGKAEWEVSFKMIACITTGASEDSCAYNGQEGDIRLIAWPLLFPFRYIGFDVLEPAIFHGVGGVAFIEQQQGGISSIDRYMDRWAEVLDNIETRKIIPFNKDNEFDQRKRLKADAPVYSPFISHRSNISRN